MVDEQFVDTTPTGPKNEGDSAELLDTEHKSPYTLTVSLFTWSFYKRFRGFDVFLCKMPFYSDKRIKKHFSPSCVFNCIILVSAPLKKVDYLQESNFVLWYFFCEFLVLTYFIFNLCIINFLS